MRFIACRCTTVWCLWLAVVLAILAVGEAQKTHGLLPCLVDTHVHMQKGQYSLACQLRVKNGASLTIDAGSTIVALDASTVAVPPAIVVESGGRIIANGTADEHITFTAQGGLHPEMFSGTIFENADEFPSNGSNWNASVPWANFGEAPKALWGGLVIAGSAPAGNTTKVVEGLPYDVFYGGTNISSDSGILRYVRVWHAGHELAPDNELNGITLAGVGNGTVIDYVEVAFGADDGLEFFGGTVNARHVSIVFVADDAVDIDVSWTGVIEYVFILMNNQSDYCVETGGGWNPVSTGHDFEVKSLTCLDMSRHRAAMLTKEAVVNGLVSNFLFYSPALSEDNISTSDIFLCAAWPCSNVTITSAASVSNESSIRAVPVDSRVTFLDPRVVTLSTAKDNSTVNGAFDSNLWLSKLSILDDFGRLPDSINDKILPCGQSTGDIHLYNSSVWTLRCTLEIMPGHTIRIDPGTTIQSYVSDIKQTSVAPVLIIRQGAQIFAAGEPDNPITFTSALPSRHLPLRGAWGGLIICGNAPVANSGSQNFVEGITNVPYGGTNATDSSGIIRYTRVWYAGRKASLDNEINSVTLAGVGSGTTIEFCEVAYGLDDGFEAFGGTVALNWVSAVNCADDAFDFDFGYEGTVTFAFSLLDSLSDSAIEIGGFNSEFSFVSLRASTLIRTHGTPSPLVTIRGGSRIVIGSSILADFTSRRTTAPIAPVRLEQCSGNSENFSTACEQTSSVAILSSTEYIGTNDSSLASAVLSAQSDCHLSEVDAVPTIQSSSWENFKNCTDAGCFDPRPQLNTKLVRQVELCSLGKPAQMHKFVGSFDPVILPWITNFSITALNFSTSHPGSQDTDRDRTHVAGLVTVIVLVGFVCAAIFGALFKRRSQPSVILALDSKEKVETSSKIVMKSTLSSDLHKTDDCTGAEGEEKQSNVSPNEKNTRCVSLSQEQFTDVTQI